MEEQRSLNSTRTARSTPSTWSSWTCISQSRLMRNYWKRKLQSIAG